MQIAFRNIYVEYSIGISCCLSDLAFLLEVPSLVFLSKVPTVLYSARRERPQAGKYAWHWARSIVGQIWCVGPLRECTASKTVCAQSNAKCWMLVGFGVVSSGSSYGADDR